jgi:hypothetical protein
MSTEDRLSAEGYSKPSLSAFRLPATNFGLILC